MANEVIENTLDVFDHHLRAFSVGLDEILKDYDDDSVILSHGVSYQGVDEIRQFFNEFLTSASAEFWSNFTVLNKEVIGEVAYLVWKSDPYIKIATDTLIIKNKIISIQTFTKY